MIQGIDIETSNLERVLNDFCEEFVEVLREKLLADGRKASGTLTDPNNLKTEIRAVGSDLKIFLTSEDYLKYVDYGRRAYGKGANDKRPPIDAIKNWVKAKGLNYNDFDLPNEKSLAYLIQGSIAKNGTLKQFGGDGRGGMYTDKTMEELFAKYEPLLQNALQQDFDIYCAKVVDEIAENLKI